MSEKIPTIKFFRSKSDWPEVLKLIIKHHEALCVKVSGDFDGDGEEKERQPDRQRPRDRERETDRDRETERGISQKQAKRASFKSLCLN